MSSLQIFPQVPNHTSNQHDWFKKSVAREKGFDNFYVWHDGYPSVNGGRPKRPNNWVRKKKFLAQIKFNHFTADLSSVIGLQ
jgi:glycosidase